MIEAGRIAAETFAPFGQVLEPGSVSPTMINEGLCARFTDLAAVDVVDGRIGMSLFQAEIRPIPHKLTLLERHPQGSQCFIPLGNSSFLVTVALDHNGVPGPPSAFVAGPEQPVNIHRNTWHGVLTPISGSGLFAVIDRIGAGPNLEEHRLTIPVDITLADGAALS